MAERECQLGRTEAEQRAALGVQYDEFCKWMSGQTVALCPEHGVVVYDGDLDRFLAGRRAIHD